MVIVFGIVFVILAKYGFPVITRMVDERKQYIDKSLLAAREANEQLANIKADSEMILAKAHEEQARIRGELSALAGGHFLCGAWALVMIHDYHHGRDFKDLGLMQQQGMFMLFSAQDATRFLARHGKGLAGNAIGGFIFQWDDGWWKVGQETNLDVHDTKATWPNEGYGKDFSPGDNNMNEEWFGLVSKDRPDADGFYEVHARAAYYLLKEAFTLDPYAASTTDRKSVV